MITDSSKFIPHVARILGGAALIALVLLAAYFLSGCGKSGYPLPRDESRSFAWQEVEAKPAGRCVAFTGSLSGAYQYLDGVRLELAPVNGPEDCPGCPFVPEEVTELTVRDVAFNRQDGTMAFSYCPTPAKAYRWRLAGISVFNRLPHATMTDRLLVMEE